MDHLRYGEPGCLSFLFKVSWLIHAIADKPWETDLS